MVLRKPYGDQEQVTLAHQPGGINRGLERVEFSLSSSHNKELSLPGINGELEISPLAITSQCHSLPLSEECQEPDKTEELNRIQSSII